MIYRKLLFVVIFVLLTVTQIFTQNLKVNNKGYFEMPGLNVD